MIFGFGSFFKNESKYRDIDLLIVHSSNEYDSCRNAISCKRRIRSRIKEANITILSVQEESHFSFVKKSTALLLGELKDNADEELLKIIEKILRKQA